MALQVSETKSSLQADETGPHRHVLFVREPLQYKPPTQAYVSQMKAFIKFLIQKFLCTYRHCHAD